MCLDKVLPIPDELKGKEIEGWRVFQGGCDGNYCSIFYFKEIRLQANVWLESHPWDPFLKFEYKPGFHSFLEKSHALKYANRLFLHPLVCKVKLRGIVAYGLQDDMPTVVAEKMMILSEAV